MPENTKIAIRIGVQLAAQVIISLVKRCFKAVKWSRMVGFVDFKRSMALFGLPMYEKSTKNKHRAFMVPYWRPDWAKVRKLSYFTKNAIILQNGKTPP